MCQTHLILLVGGNPLPCLVSARYQAPKKQRSGCFTAPQQAMNPELKT